MSGRYLSHACLIITVICLIGTCAPVLAVNPGDVKAQIISPEYARVLAESALLEFVLSGSPGVTSGSWEGSVITPNPVIIYDTNGEPLFYQFEVKRADVSLGGIKIGASRVLPSSVMTIELTPLYWDDEEAEDMAEASLMSICPECTIVSSDPVCYSYPKIGEKITYIRSGSDVTEEYILDLATSSQVTRGSSWSYYESLEEGVVTSNRAAWDDEEKIHALVLEKARKYGYSDATPLSQQKLQALREATAQYNQAISGGVIIRGAQEHLVTGSGQQKILSLTLHGQEKSDWCAVATIQMISEYFGKYYTQSQIAGRTNTVMWGTYVDDEVDFFIVHLGQQGSYADFSPSFQKEVVEIENNRPFSSTVESNSIAGYHGRVGAGYNNDWGRDEIYIYDPWPVNEGMIYWEAYSSREHLCDIYIRGSDTSQTKPPVASFSFSVNQDTVTFTDTSTGNPTTWYWTLGDGSISTVQNPRHTYTQSSSYWVTLTAYNDGGSSKSIDSVYVSSGTIFPTTIPPATKPTVSLKPMATPTVYPTTSTKVFPTATPTVYPTTSTKVFPTVYPTVYPTTSTKVFPTVYPTTSPKVYPTVSPTISPAVVPTVSPTIFQWAVPVQPAQPVASFQYFVNGNVVKFLDTSASGPTSWYWTFGDGTSSDIQNPGHSYSNDGMYTVTLRVTNSGGTSETSKNIRIATRSGSGQNMLW